MVDVQVPDPAGQAACPGAGGVPDGAAGERLALATPIGQVHQVAGRLAERAAQPAQRLVVAGHRAVHLEVPAAELVDPAVFEAHRGAPVPAVPPLVLDRVAEHAAHTAEQLVGEHERVGHRLGAPVATDQVDAAALEVRVPAGTEHVGQRVARRVAEPAGHPATAAVLVEDGAAHLVHPGGRGPQDRSLRVRLTASSTVTHRRFGTHHRPQRPERPAERRVQEPDAVTAVEARPVTRAGQQQRALDRRHPHPHVLPRLRFGTLGTRTRRIAGDEAVALRRGVVVRRQPLPQP